MTPGVSVVVPAYNCAGTIGTTLQALLGQEFDEPLEIFVIDDCSTDQTGDICRSLGIEASRNPSNMGLAASLNRGILMSKNGIVVTLHSDVVPLSKDWLKRLIAPLSGTDTGATCSLQHPPDFDARRLTFWEKLLWGKLRPHYALNNKADAYKKDILARVGVFDQDRFRTAGEDEDMALRLRRQRFKVVSSKGEVIHDHKFRHDSNGKVLRMILAKEYSYARGGGALRRKFVWHRPGAYVYPSPKSPLYDGLVRVGLCVGVFIPYLQFICIPLLLAISFSGIRATAQRVRRRTELVAYPLLNLMRYWTYTVGYVVGFVSGRER